MTTEKTKGKGTGKAVIKYEHKDIELKLKLQFPKDMQANPHLAAEIYMLCVNYGLDFFMGDIIPLYGKAYFTFEARLKKAQQTKELERLNYRPFTNEEREEWGLPKEEYPYVFAAIGRRKGMTEDYMAPGYLKKRDLEALSKAHDEYRNPILREHPVLIARKRAGHRWLREVFPDSLAGIGVEEVITEGEYEVKEIKTEGPHEHRAVVTGPEVEEHPEDLFPDEVLVEIPEEVSEEVATEVDAEIGQPQQWLTTSQALLAWNAVKGMMATAKPKDALVVNWFKVHYSIDVKMSDFDLDEPPEKFTEPMLSHFHNALSRYQQGKS